MVFFKIGNTDFTEAINAQDFEVNNEEVYTSWTDINGNEHRDHVRKRISGRFVLGYASASDFAAAVSTITTAIATNGYTSCQVYANNDGATHTINAYLTLTGEGKYDFVNQRQWQTLQVDIMER